MKKVTLTELIITIISSIGIFLIVLEMRKERISVEPIQVPEKLAKRGFTPRVAAQYLIAHIHKIQKGAATTMERGVLEGTWSAPDLTLPAADVSIRSAAAYLLHLFGRPFSIVSGVLLETEKGGHVRLRLQVNGKEVTDIYEEDTAMDRLVEKGAREVVKATEPYVLASYYYARCEKKRPRR